MDITPFHRHMIPAMLRHSSTAAAAPSIAAEPTAPMVPFSSPQATAAATIPVQIHAIAIFHHAPPVLDSRGRPSILLRGGMETCKNFWCFLVGIC